MVRIFLLLQACGMRLNHTSLDGSESFEFRHGRAPPVRSYPHQPRLQDLTSRAFRVQRSVPTYVPPFALHAIFITRVSSSVLSCASRPEPQIRIVVNDGVTPLGGVRGCPPDDPHGLCPVSMFVAAQRETIQKTDWAWACHGAWDVPPGHGWNTTTGEPPAKDAV